ncbi:UNVERIFIED_CONTAM: Pik3c3 [Trichonephila clavipes]
MQKNSVFSYIRGTLEGRPQKPSYKALIDDPILKYSGLCEDKCSDLYVTCQVFADNKPLAFPVQTSYKAFTTRWNWNEWLTLPVKFCELPRNALLALTVWDIYGPNKSIPVGGATVSVFGKYGALRQGMHDLRLWNNVEADGNLSTRTPGKTDCSKEQMTKLSKDGDALCYNNNSNEIVLVPDPEISGQNLVEAKHHKLARSIRNGPTDRDLKPNAIVKNQLVAICDYLPTKVLTSEEQDLIWKFRFTLTSYKKGLAKFLKCVNWKISSEEKQALDLLSKWHAMDVEDALELLSPQYTHPIVRKYAVNRLAQASDDVNID